MRTTIQIVLLSLLAVETAQGQTPVEQQAIFRQFEQTVAAYTQQFDCAGHATLTPPDAIFTLPVAMLFRQRIAQVFAGPIDGPTMTAANRLTQPDIHPSADEPFPIADSVEVPAVLEAAFPHLPPGLEYRFVRFDLVLRDTERNAVVAVLRDAVRHTSTASANRRQQ